ncbi:hypothetical protein KPH14_007083 [Odynerus spinipes]|uniref:Uncharacterized protein n=1 Tax=Odynerus spinipes TaxID=1348599 RepID=A0AAD9RRT9_9HYME|nr:hypothetical protein KPH14_007083 [Odynerus spinipes]
MDTCSYDDLCLPSLDRHFFYLVFTKRRPSKIDKLLTSIFSSLLHEETHTAIIEISSTREERKASSTPFESSRFVGRGQDVDGKAMKTSSGIIDSRTRMDKRIGDTGWHSQGVVEITRMQV